MNKSILLLAILALAGCRKENHTPSPPSPERTNEIPPMKSIECVLVPDKSPPEFNCCVEY